MLSAARRRTRRTPWLQLLSALLELGQGKAELVRHSERAWASVTFSGTRHSVILVFTGEEAVAAGEALIDALPDHEFSIPGQLVADAAVVRVDHTAPPLPRLEVAVEVLMLDEV
ncbi:hypothetical protein [Novosphingobium sp.]|uniref:hypothetical protein n=1 Tax=Novosphingobium sp. TaxID=1874826 RepID=UPI00286A6183|nr:hypothetical protein [Novosphingobium sp.]